MKEIMIYLIIATLPNGKYGLIGLNEEVYIPFEYSNLYRLNEKHLKAQNSNGLWGIIDIRNNICIPFEYEDLGYDMNFNLIRAKKDNQWGILNETGEIVLPFKYDHISDFDLAGRAFITKNGHQGVINTSFEKLIPNNYKRLYPFIDNVSVFIDSNGQYGCIDSDNKTLFKLEKGYKLKYAYNNPDKKIITKIVDNIVLNGVIDLKGNIIIEPEYRQISIKRKNGIEYVHGINDYYKKGNTEFELFINGTKQNFNGIIRFLDSNYGINKDRTVISVESNSQKKYGIIDAQGLIVVPIEYQNLRYLRRFENDKVNGNNLIFAQKGEKYGIINENEEIYFDFKYPNMRYLNHGFYRNDVQEGTLLYNKCGRLIFESPEIWFGSQIEGKPNCFYAVDSHKMYGIISKDGKWAIQPKYKKLGFVREYRKL